MLAEKRLALMFCDGSMTVLSPDVSLSEARREALSCDENQTDPALMTRLARIWIGEPETLETPSLIGQLP
jgi:hypothetical protein